MGLFSNKKQLCPVCGEPTPRLFSTKVEDMPLCKACASKVFLPNGALEQMSFDEFTQYMNYYEENQVLRDKFQPNYEFCVDGGMTIKMDTRNGLFSLNGADNALVFEKSCIETYRILEDDQPLFQGNKKAIKFFESKIPQVVKEMKPMISQFEMQKREYEMMEHRERMEHMERRDRMDHRDHMNGMGDRYDDRNRPPHRYHPRPTFYGNEPFKYFKVRVRMEHPYWQGIHQGKISAPIFNSEFPSVENYMYDYNQQVENLRDLALQFKALVNPKSKEIYDGEKVNTASAVAQTIPVVVQAAAEVDVVEEIKKFKGLLDAGVITEDEFAAKKKKLLGI